MLLSIRRADIFAHFITLLQDLPLIHLSPTVALEFPSHRRISTITLSERRPAGDDVGLAVVQADL